MHLVEEYQNSKIQQKGGGNKIVVWLTLENVDEWVSKIKLINLILKKLESDLNFPGRFREEQVNRDLTLRSTDIWR